MKAKAWLLVAAFCLLFGGLPVSGFAARRGGGGMHNGGSERGESHEGFRDRDFGRGYGRAYIGPSLGWGWGWNTPWIWGWGPYYYPQNSLEVRHVNYGTVEFKVKPENTKVYIDNKYVGTVGELDHHRAYMAQGNHEIKLEAPDGQTMDRTIFIAAGKKIKIKENL